MRSLSWRRILYIITFVLFALAIVFWVLTLVGWFITQPGFEPLNVLAAAIVSSLGGFLALLKARTASDTPVTEYNPSPAQRERDRRAMLELVRNTWIKGVLAKSLHGAVMLELGLQDRPEFVERPWDVVLRTIDQPNCTLPRGTKIINIFDELNGALLILGEPGSGKTTMLLELARDLITRAERDHAQPMPVILNLSSWTEKQQHITDWLVDELAAKYNIPKRIAVDWVENEELLLLLDGLDEVRLQCREGCVKAINEFRQKHLVGLAVCSRTAEYETLATRLKLQSAIVLQPLSPEQINTYLAGAGIELLAVHKTLKHDTLLQELAQSPLMLSIMALAYKGMSVENLQPLDTIEARRRHVFDAYVQRMLERRSTDRCYTREQTIHWLSWLARQMVEHAQTVFLIERMQPSWFSTHGLYLQYLLGSALIVGLIDGLIVGLIVGLFGGLIVGLIVGLISGLIVGQFAFAPRVTESIQMAETLSLSWRGVLGGLIGGLIGGLFFGLISGLIFGPSRGLSSRLSAGLSLGLFGGLIRGLSAKPIETRRQPNQGIRQSAKNALLVGLIFGLSIGLIFGLIVGPIFGLIVGPYVVLIVGLNYGGIACVQHFTLRLILYCSGHIPWRYAKFLDYAADRILLQKVGGGYIFIHRLLMEYFAELEAE